jgi:hypothetical protein
VQRKRVSASGPHDLHAIQPLGRRGASPTGYEQRDVVAPLGKPAEDLVQMDLRTARLRVSAVLPVDDEDSRSGSRGFTR